MVETQEQQEDREAYRRAVRLSEKANPLPEEAEREYQGPDALGQATLRGAVFAVVGWVLGTRLANLGSESEHSSDTKALQRRKFKANNIGAAAALIGGVMGAYGGMKDTRFHRKQIEELQSALRGQHAKVADLKEELRLQLSGQGRLQGYDPEWEKAPAKTADDKKDDRPQNSVAQAEFSGALEAAETAVSPTK